MLTRKAFMDFLDSRKIDYWFTKCDLPMLVSGADGVTVKLTSKFNGRVGDTMMVSRFERKDNKVYVKYLGMMDLWTVDELVSFVNERGYRL